MVNPKQTQEASNKILLGHTLRFVHKDIHGKSNKHKCIFKLKFIWVTQNNIWRHEILFMELQRMIQQTTSKVVVVQKNVIFCATKFAVVEVKFL
jgi:hypothetical protein